MFDYLWALYNLIAPLPCPLLWQMDGRPMSGDLGVGATRAAVKLGQKAVAAGLPGYIQLAGGTNHHTVPKLKALGLLHPDLLDSPVMLDAADIQLEAFSSKFSSNQTSAYVAGVAYGSYARMLLAPLLDELDTIVAVTQLAEVSQSVRSVGAAPYPLSSVAASDRAAAVQLQASWRSQPLGLEERPDQLWQAVTLAHTLVSQLKTFNSSQRTRLNL